MIENTAPPGGASACAPAGFETRWVKGQSGNPRGGPRRPAPRAAHVEKLMRREFEVVVDGERERLPFVEALLVSLAYRALRGDAKAVDQVLRLMAETEQTRAAEAAARAQQARRRADERRLAEEAARARREAEAELAAEDAAFAETAAAFDVDEGGMFDAEHALMRLGVLLPGPDEPLVPEWVVEAARARRPDLAMTDADRRILERVTLAEADVWPELAEAYGRDPEAAADNAGGGGPAPAAVEDEAADEPPAAPAGSVCDGDPAEPVEAPDPAEPPPDPPSPDREREVLPHDLRRFPGRPPPGWAPFGPR